MLHTHEHAHDHNHDHVALPRESVAVLFGGRSSEHEVSLISARTIIAALEEAGFATLPVLIGKDGRWSVNGHERVLRSDGTGGRLIAPDGSATETFDVAFPIAHGTFGEDGSLQGLLELADVPYVGCGVAASAVGMDKILQKHLLHDVGIPVVPWTSTNAQEWVGEPDAVIARVEELGYPCFVKPANLGSSVGVDKAHHIAELRAAIEIALRYDTRVIIERAVPGAREIEIAILGNGPYHASVAGEIVPSNEFYDYAAKYLDGASATHVPADLLARTRDAARNAALRACNALDVKGMARVDFLLARDSGELYLNEINTLPGFTDISMYPRLWQASGVPIPELARKLVELAREHHRSRAALVRALPEPPPV